MKLPTPFDGGYPMSYHHLSMFDRARIQSLYTLGYSTRQIAIQTGRHHSSIARELVRNATTENVYLAEDAHQSYENRRTHSKPHGKYDKAIADVIEEKATFNMVSRANCASRYPWKSQF